MIDIDAIKDQIESILDKWFECDLNDIAKIVDMRRIVSVYYYNLSEYKSQQESNYLQSEYERKDYFASRKKYYLDLGKSVAHSTSIAEIESNDKKYKEIQHESNFKMARDMINSLDHVLNAMSSAIKVAENEQRQSNYHT